MTHRSGRITGSREPTILQPETPGQPAIRYRTSGRAVPEHCLRSKVRFLPVAVGPKRLSLRPAYPPYPVEAVLPASPNEPVVPAEQNREPLEPAGLRLEVNHGEPELPVGAAHVALAARAHREILDAE